MSDLPIRKDAAETDANCGKPLTMSVPAAGKHYFGLERQASYKAANRGDLEVMRVGGRLRVVTAAMDAKMARIKELAVAKVDAAEHEQFAPL